MIYEILEFQADSNSGWVTVGVDGDGDQMSMPVVGWAIVEDQDGESYTQPVVYRGGASVTPMIACGEDEAKAIKFVGIGSDTWREACDSATELE